MSDETLPKNKLNIKSDLQNFWKDKEEIKGEEMPIKNDWFNDDKYKNKNNKNSINLNTEEENEYKSTIILTIISIIAIYLVYEVYSYIQVQKQNDAIINQQIIEYNKQIIEKQKALNSQSQTYNQNRDYGNYKYFKIKYSADKNYDYNFVYNMQVITSNLNKVKSRSDDNNYDIEIVGNISKYGGLFYRIDKRKVSNEYDDQISNILSELKKIKFRLQEDTVNFKIYVNNNSYDLN